jgi:NDP-sugar pyrophosphorylase family protein
MNIVIPAAGLGSRFVSAGYSIPKPFIPIKGKAMIEHVVDNLVMPGDKVYIICQVEHMPYFAATGLLHRGDVCLVPQQGQLYGAAYSVAVLAQNFIDNDEPLLIANSDQWVDYDKVHFREAVLTNDATIMTFKANETKWSYARLDDSGRVVEVAEKIVISDYATVGIYGFKHGYYFVEAAMRMMAKEIKTNGWFYVCPAFNEMLDKDIRTYDVPGMFGMGTPEDLEANYNAVGANA